jgi:hypothetical protein
MMMNRRSFSTALVASTATSFIWAPVPAAISAPVPARNVVLVHGLFADGSSWSEVIARLQAAGLNIERQAVLVLWRMRRPKPAIGLMTMDTNSENFATSPRKHRLPSLGMMKTPVGEWREAANG